jgi:hypothetical protein
MGTNMGANQCLCEAHRSGVALLGESFWAFRENPVTRAGFFTLMMTHLGGLWRVGIRIMDLKCYNADMKFHPGKILLVVVLFAFGCKKQPVEISELSPRAFDGVLEMRMNHTAHDDLLTGHWSAPRLDRDQKFYRSPLTTHSGISFRIPKKEAILVEMDISQIAPSLVIKINTKEFPVSGNLFRETIAATDVNIGENQISFQFSETDEMHFKQINIYPKRFRKVAHRIKPGSDFLTPVQLHYYCNPLKGSWLDLSFIFQGKEPIQGKIIIESEENRREYIQPIC